MQYDSSRSFHEQLAHLVEAHLEHGGDPDVAIDAMALQAETVRIRTNTDDEPEHATQGDITRAWDEVE